MSSPRRLNLVQVLMLTPVSDYIVQGSRFRVYTGFGCTNALDGSTLAILLLDLWPVILPLLSITVYYCMSSTNIGVI